MDQLQMCSTSGNQLIKVPSIVQNENCNVEFLNYEQFCLKYNENNIIYNNSFTNVVHIIDMKQENGIYKIYRELAEGSILNFYTMKRMSYVTTKNCLKEVFNGLYVLLKKNIVPSNVYPESFVICKIDDDKIIGKLLNALLYDSTSPEALIYCSPEQIQSYVSSNHNFMNTEASIVFSAGLCLHNILTKGNHLFCNEKLSIIQNISDEKFEKDYSTLKNSVDPWEFELLKDLIEKMTFNGPSKRITFEQVVNHIFFWTKNKRDRFFNASFMYMSDPIDYEVNNDLKLRETLKDWKKILSAMITTKKEIDSYGKSPSEAIRYIRNLLAHHLQKINADVRKELGLDEDTFGDILMKCFPSLILYLYEYNTKNLHEPMFKEFYHQKTEEERTLKAPDIVHYTNHQFQNVSPVNSSSSTPTRSGFLPVAEGSNERMQPVPINSTRYDNQYHQYPSSLAPTTIRNRPIIILQTNNNPHFMTNNTNSNSRNLYTSTNTPVDINTYNNSGINLCPPPVRVINLSLEGSSLVQPLNIIGFSNLVEAISSIQLNNRPYFLSTLNSSCNCEKCLYKCSSHYSN